MSSTGKDIGYIVSINDSINRTIKIDDPFKTEIIFNNLSPPNTEFLIKLHTFNRIGTSKISIETTEQTFEDG